MKLRLSLACSNYDRTRALSDGHVGVDGVELICLDLPVEEIAPYRADHVGSLLRPPELLEARAAFAAGRTSRDQLRAHEARLISPSLTTWSPISRCRRRASVIEASSTAH